MLFEDWADMKMPRRREGKGSIRGTDIAKAGDNVPRILAHGRPNPSTG